MPIYIMERTAPLDAVSALKAAFPATKRMRVMADGRSFSASFGRTRVRADIDPAAETWEVLAQYGTTTTPDARFEYQGDVETLATILRSAFARPRGLCD